jgi:hypothetical protein
MTTKTVEQFTTELKVALDVFSEQSWEGLLKPTTWGLNDRSDLIRFYKHQFESWPDVLKNAVKIVQRTDGNLDSSHSWLSFRDLNHRDLNQISRIKDINLNQVDLTGARLPNAYLARASMIATKLTDADLTGADLTGANLWGADLSGAKGLLDEDQNKKIPTDANEWPVLIDKNTTLPNDLLCCYFNPKLYQNDDKKNNNSGFIDNPTTFDEFKFKFIKKYFDSSNPIVTPPGSRFNLKVSGDIGDINAWVEAMLPALEKAWDAREAERKNDPTRVKIDEFMAAFNAADGNQQS